MLTHFLLNRFPRVSHAFFTREGGASEGIYASLNCGPGSRDAPSRVQENRRRAMAAFGLSGEQLATARQVHGKTVFRVERPWEAAGAPEADGLVTNVAGIALGILTADCAPVLLADMEARVIGAAHAGWRGAKGGVLEAVVSEMARLGAEASRIAAVIGPCIGAGSYAVGPEFPVPFLAEDAANARFFVEGEEGRLRFDLGAYVESRLGKAGVASVARVEADTCREATRFFSYRRSLWNGEPDYGRALSAIALREEEG